MRAIKIYLPDYFTEAHRTSERQADLRAALEAEGVLVVSIASPSCDLALCGSIWLQDHCDREAEKYGLPVVQYCWDLYPWQLEGKSEHCWRPELWEPYLASLRRCREVWVPSRCTAERVKEFAGRDARVILCSVKPWDDVEPFDGGWVVDVMRPYPDPNCREVDKACSKLGIPCVETRGNLPWEEFQRVIAGAALLVSAYEEASTGGLTLLEGYALGKPVLLSDSPRLGARDYFGSRAAYFRYDDREDLCENIGFYCRCPPRYSAAESRSWVQHEYSDRAFARRIAARLRELLS